MTPEEGIPTYSTGYVRYFDRDFQADHLYSLLRKTHGKWQQVGTRACGTRNACSATEPPWHRGLNFSKHIFVPIKFYNTFFTVLKFMRFLGVFLQCHLQQEGVDIPDLSSSAKALSATMVTRQSALY